MYLLMFFILIITPPIRPAEPSPAGTWRSLAEMEDGHRQLTAFIDRQVTAARSRLVVSTSEQGRAIFGIVDLDRDRRLGAREVMRTVDRVMSWDSDGDGRVSADEIPYHFQITIARGGLIGLSRAGSDSPVTGSTALRLP